MEDEKKKKKNKKKKNKQNKSTVDTTNGVGDSGNTDHNHASAQDHQTRVSEITQVQNEVPKIDVDVENRLSDGVESVVLEEAVETSQRENNPATEQQASLEETRIGLRNDNNAHFKEEDSLEDRSVGLQNDNGVHIQKEASLEERSIELPNDNGVEIQKEELLDEKIKSLQEESEIHLHKEAFMASKLLELEKEKDSWLHKQTRLEEEFSHLVGKTDSLLSKEASLEEKFQQLELERDLWLMKEQNSTQETMASLNDNVSRLQAQVLKLEESRNYLLHENQRLGEILSGVQIQIENLEKRVSVSSSATVLKLEESRNYLLHENQRLGEILSGVQIQVENLEKRVSVSSSATANDVYVEPDPQGVDAVSESIVGIAKQVENADSTTKITETPSSFTDQIDISKDIVIQDERNIADDLMEKDTAHAINSLSESSKATSRPVKTIESFEDVAFQSESEDHRNIGAKDSILVSNSPYGNGTNEIMQIPMDEKHVGGPTLQPQSYEEKTDVPLSDSPLIGAPFRIVSFFARYVSGADLVNKS